MSDSSQVEVSYQVETTFGTVDSGSAFTALRHTGGSFPHGTETARSNEVRGDGQRGGTFRSNVTASPTLNIEFSPTTFDDFIKGIMRDTWSTSVTASGTDVTSTDDADGTGSFDSATDIDFTTTNIDVGQWVYVSGFTSEGSNGWFKVLGVSAGTLDVAPAPADDTNSGGNSISFEGEYIRNGTTDISYALQRQFKDLSNKWELIKGNRIGSMDLSIEPGSLITGSMAFEGLKKTLETSNAGNAINDASSTGIFNAIDQVSAIMTDRDGNIAPISGDVMSLSLSLNQNARRQNAVGTLGATGIKLGSIDATGSLSLYLDGDTWAILQDYVDFTKFGLALVMDDGTNGYVFEFPTIALTSEPGNIPGPDDDVMLEFDWAAEPGESYNKTVQVSKR